MFGLILIALFVLFLIGICGPTKQQIEEDNRRKESWANRRAADKMKREKSRIKAKAKRDANKLLLIQAKAIIAAQQ